MSGPSTPGLLAAVAVLSAGTFAYRIAGPALKAKVTLTERTRRLTDTATVVLLTALVATAALLQAGSPAGTPALSGSSSPECWPGGGRRSSS